jgi:hypothetical protein
MIPEVLNEKETTLLSALGVDGQLIITIDATHTNGYWAFLKDNGVSCTEPKPASFHVIVYDVDGHTRTIIKATNTFHIIAKGTEKDWNDWTSKWIDMQRQ